MSLTTLSDRERVLVLALIGMMYQFSCDFMTAGEYACATLGHAVQTTHKYNPASFHGIPCHCLDRTAPFTSAQVEKEPDILVPFLRTMGNQEWSDITETPR